MRGARYFPAFTAVAQRMQGSFSTYTEPQAIIAVGANIGDRLSNILQGIQRLQQNQISVLRYSRLYESEAAYVTDQPAFLNAALAVQTLLEPDQLLRALKAVEAAAGRDFQGQRWGPRPLDLDIIFYGDTTLASKDLQIPHARWQERDFVKAPIADLYTTEELQNQQWSLAASLRHVQHLWYEAGGDGQLTSPSLKAVVPLKSPLKTWAWQGRSHVMGVLNATPDSFSDGGLSAMDVNVALVKAKKLVADGADIIDIGGQSTRPGAAPVTAEEECCRVLPIIRAIEQEDSLADVLISADTFQSEVAKRAVAAGADIINDVSGGIMDNNMYSVVADLGVPYIMMHMRGTPETMTSRESTSYTPGQLASEVSAELQHRIDLAVSAGIEPWRIITDPGIGFAKSSQGNHELIRNLADFRKQLKGCLKGQPMLAGPSRKRFLGNITGRQIAIERDTASAVAASFCIAGSANIIRMHDAAAGWDAARVSDAIIQH